ncbi:MAG: GGDEF domain-containing protein [Desulfosudaceae bacterium]
MNDLTKLLLTDDRHQSLRIKRFSLALSGYLVLLAMVLVNHSFGFVRDLSIYGTLALGGSLLAANTVIYALLRSGASLRFKDPSLTILQMMIGIVFMTIVSYYSTNILRGINLMVYILIFIFGTFRLRMREFFVLVGITLVLYIAAMTLLHRANPAEAVFRLEAMRSFILLVSLLWMSILASYIANLRRKVRRLATHDSLTNLHNRREGFASLAREKAFADRTGLTFAVCMIDLDNFKAINDTYGHQAGDTVLKRFSQAIKDNIRNEDYVARYGGEEFLVIFVNFECRDGNLDCLQRLLNVVRELRFPEISESLRLTASFGVAGYLPGESTDSLVDRADQALYHAKAKGKNRIEYDCETP